MAQAAAVPTVKRRTGEGWPRARRSKTSRYQVGDPGA